MTIALLAIEVKHERRVRLVFSQPLAGGAFGTPGPAYYTVTCTDSTGPSPSVSAAMLVGSNTSVVELALADALVLGGLYSISAVGVPAADASVTPAGSVLPVRFGVTAPKENIEPIKRNRDRLLYGVDLLWNGVDYQETSTGDLESIGGTPNVTKALYRRAESQGLPWDPAYGVRLRDYVDSPSLASGTLRGALSSQMLKDPRVRSVKTSVQFTDDDTTLLSATPVLISGEPCKPVSIVVPSDA